MYKHTLVSRKRIEYIAYNYELTSHAKERIKERQATNVTLKESILKSPLSWRCKGDIIKIALNKDEFLIVSDSTETRAHPIVITFVTATEGTVIDEFIRDYL